MYRVIVRLGAGTELEYGPPNADGFHPPRFFDGYSLAQGQGEDDYCRRQKDGFAWYYGAESSSWPSSA